MARGVTNPVLGDVWWLLEICRIFFQSILVKGDILAYFSFLKTNGSIKRVWPFKATLRIQ